MTESASALIYFQVREELSKSLESYNRPSYRSPGSE